MRAGSSATRSQARARTAARARATARARGLTPAETAWIAAAPSALVVLALMAAAAPFGRLMAPHDVPHFFPSLQYLVRPEPTEHARYLVALLGPLLVSGAVLARARVGRLRPSLVRGLVLCGQALAVAVVLAGLVVQHALTFSPYGEKPRFHVNYFTWPTIAVALALAALLALALRREDVIAAVRERSGDGSRGRLAAGAVAVAMTATWLLTAINTDGSIANANRAVFDNVAFWFDETFALLNGRAPLVEFHAQYSQLWPYVAGGIMSLAGASLGLFTAIMATASGLALLAVYDVLRRIVRSSLLALGLYLPFLATGFFTERGPLDNRYGPVNAFSMWPMRYAGPYLLAWATARQVSRPSRRWRPVLFLAGGLVAINNPEFGVPAFGATLAALVWTGGVRPRQLARLLGDAALGLLGAVLAVCALTLVVAGSLPDFGLLTQFPRLYGVDGFGMLRMPAFSFHLAVYLTFAAALVLATVRAVRREPDVLLTAMLAWAGTFGLGAGSYFAGRSHPEVLVDLFSAWALALVLLLVATVRAILARPTRRPALAELAVLFGFGLAICSLAQTPAPWSQVQRLGHVSRTPGFADNAAERFVARATRPGEPVLLLTEAGHRIAYDVGVVNVSPYASAESIPTQEQLSDAIRILREHGGTKLFILSADPAQADRPQAIQTMGFRLVKVDRASELMEFVDRR